VKLLKQDVTEGFTETKGIPVNLGKRGKKGREKHRKNWERRGGEG